MQGWGGTHTLHRWRGVRSNAECWLRWLCGEHDKADSHLPIMQIWAVPESRENGAKTSHHTRNYPAGSMDTYPCPWAIPVKWWQWWNFLILYIPIRPALHSAGGSRWDSLPSCVCSPSQQDWSNYQAVLLHLKVSREWSPVCADSWIVDDWLWNCSQECRARDLSKLNHPGVFLPLHAMCLENCGLTTEFRDHGSFHQLVRRAAVLPLIPSHRVEDVWFLALEDNKWWQHRCSREF